METGMNVAHLRSILTGILGMYALCIAVDLGQHESYLEKVRRCVCTTAKVMAREGLFIVQAPGSEYRRGRCDAYLRHCGCQIESEVYNRFFKNPLVE